LKVNIVHPNLNICGGGERLSIAVMEAVKAMGDQFDITTFEWPNLCQISVSFGKLSAQTIMSTSKINIMESALDCHLVNKEYKSKCKYDLTINTHSDSVPYYCDYFSKNNCISYCHFPTAKDHIDIQNLDFLKETRLLKKQIKEKSASRQKWSNSKLFQLLNESYDKLIRNSTLITNSEFSKKIIFEKLGINAQVLYPPVDIDRFRKRALLSKTRQDTVLVLCRIVPYKNIESAIGIAKILKDNDICKKMKIIGNLHDYDYVRRDYYAQLTEMRNSNGLQEFVVFDINAHHESVIESMHSAKAYLHTVPGEPFGISTVEAMSAGLVPAVPDLGGHTEFVPQRYQYDTAYRAADIISSAMKASNSERMKLSNSVRRFSTSNYIQSFIDIINNVTIV
jgi:glycosyltransferase involved in cell wall biosynthesis